MQRISSIWPREATSLERVANVEKGLLVHIFSYTRDHDLCRARRVCRKWKTIIDHDKILNSRIFKAVEVILPIAQVIRMIQERPTRNFANQQIPVYLRELFTDAMKFLGWGHSLRFCRVEKNRLLQMIVEIQSGCDRQAAKATAELIEDEKMKVSALFSVASIQPLCIEEAKALAGKMATTREKEQAHSKIAIHQARYDPMEAHLTAQKIEKNLSLKDKVLVEIAKELVLKSTEEAEVIIQEITPENRDLALAEIAGVLALQSCEKAKAIAQKISNPFVSVSAYVKIAEFDPECDLTSARLQVDAIRSTAEKARALILIAEADPECDLTSARVQVDAIHYPTSKNRELIRLAKVDPKHDLKAAKRAAQDNEHLLLEIVKVEVDYNLEEAKKTALLINEPILRAEAQAMIASHDPEHDLRQLKESFLCFEGQFLKDKMLFKVLKATYRSNPEVAREIEREIKGFSYKYKAQALLDFTAARWSEEDIINPYKKAMAMLKIAKIHLQSLTSS